MGGGRGYFLPKSDKAGRRKDEANFLEKFQANGYALGDHRDRDEDRCGRQTTTARLLGLFHPGNLDGALDRHILKKGTVTAYPDQPDLVEQTQAAIDILSKQANGFLLMVEIGTDRQI